MKKYLSFFLLAFLLVTTPEITKAEQISQADISEMAEIYTSDTADDLEEGKVLAEPPEENTVELPILSGGITFEDAVSFPKEMLGIEFSLDNHLKRNTFTTFTLSITPEQKITILTRSNANGINITKNNEVIEGGEAAEDHEDILKETDSPYSGITIYTSEQVKAVSRQLIGKAFSEERLDFSVEKNQTLYIFLGSVYNDVHKDTKFLVDVNEIIIEAEEDLVEKTIAEPISESSISQGLASVTNILLGIIVILLFIFVIFLLMKGTEKRR